ncbi:MAG: hypothetical protein A2005_11760 [Desulfuromonadales bacterium GWC2_61_20]|nr:MAG: hypothetical protein A2005_11760 [Desulfuromonadales bacterium GWC2_61_20]HAD04232.1 hypothetical protein [Desulfuromonas sp.]
MLPPSAPKTAAPLPELAKPLQSATLANGLCLEFYDFSNRYFGDYHRVCIEVRTSLPLDAPVLTAFDPALLTKARALFGVTLTVTRTVERMGVAGAQVEAVKTEIIAGLLHEAHNYLSRPDYPGRLLTAELGRKPTSKLKPTLK